MIFLDFLGQVLDSVFDGIQDGFLRDIEISIQKKVDSWVKKLEDQAKEQQNQKSNNN